MPPEAGLTCDAAASENEARDDWAPVDLTFPATCSNVRETLASLESHLGHMNLSRETLGDVEIVLAEILNNVVEHAYGMDRSGNIELHMERRETRMMFLIADTGRAFPDNRLPGKKTANVDVERQNLPEGGFGWALIHELVEEVSYTRKNGKNLIRVGLQLA